MEECYSSLVLAVLFPGGTKKYHESSNSVADPDQSSTAIPSRKL